MLGRWPTSTILRQFDTITDSALDNPILNACPAARSAGLWTVTRSPKTCRPTSTGEIDDVTAAGSPCTSRRAGAASASLVLGRVTPAVVAGIRPVPDAFDLELVEVAVEPAEGGLQDIVELGQPDVLGYGDPSPHRRLRTLVNGNNQQWRPKVVLR